VTGRAVATAVYLMLSAGLVVGSASWLAAVVVGCWGVSLAAAFPKAPGLHCGQTAGDGKEVNANAARRG
jgi:uncharacterized membrane protein YjjB (DUF3815 family)